MIFTIIRFLCLRILGRAKKQKMFFQPHCKNRWHFPKRFKTRWVTPPRPRQCNRTAWLKIPRGAQGHRRIRGSDTKNNRLTVNTPVDCRAPELPASSGEGRKLKVSTWCLNRPSAAMCHSQSVVRKHGSAPAALQGEHHKTIKKKKKKAVFVEFASIILLWITQFVWTGVHNRPTACVKQVQNISCVFIGGDK